MKIVAFISCPAPFERLEAFLSSRVRAPTIGDRTTRKPYEEISPRYQSKMLVRSASAADQVLNVSSANDVGQQAKETRALDGAREFALLLGGNGRDAARHDLAALGHIAHQQLGILVVDFRRI